MVRVNCKQFTGNNLIKKIIIFTIGKGTCNETLYLLSVFHFNKHLPKINVNCYIKHQVAHKKHYKSTRFMRKGKFA